MRKINRIYIVFCIWATWKNPDVWCHWELEKGLVMMVMMVMRLVVSDILSAPDSDVQKYWGNSVLRSWSCPSRRGGRCSGPWRRWLVTVSPTDWDMIASSDEWECSAQAGWSLESPDDLHYLAIIISHTLNDQSSTVSLSFRLLEQSDSTLLG